MPRKQNSTDRALDYASNVALGIPKSQAAIAAGYSPGSHTYDIEQKKCVKVALATVEQQREKLRNTYGFSITDVAKRLHKRATDDEVHAGVQTDNDKVLISMLGYNAPQEINVNNKSLFMEFSDLTSKDLEVLAKAYIPEVE